MQTLRYDLLLRGRGAARILVEAVPATDAWEAIADRLRRAAGAGTDAGLTDAT
jgi:hypothetical protein